MTEFTALFDRTITPSTSSNDPTIGFVYSNDTERVMQTGRAIAQTDIDQRHIFAQADNGSLWYPSGTPSAVTWNRLGGSATTTVEPWQSLAIADSPVAFTHEQRAAIDLTGTTAIAPMILNVAMPPLEAGQTGESIITDVQGTGTWGTGFLRLNITNGSGVAVVTTVPNFSDSSQTSVANDGIVNINQQDLRGQYLVLRYFSNTGRADIRAVDRVDDPQP